MAIMRPDTIPGAAFGVASFAACVFLCALFLPINRDDFWRGAIMAWSLLVILTAVFAGWIFVSMKVWPK